MLGSNLADGLRMQAVARLVGGQVSDGGSAIRYRIRGFGRLEPDVELLDLLEKLGEQLNGEIVTCEVCAMGAGAESPIGADDALGLQGMPWD